MENNTNPVAGAPVNPAPVQVQAVHSCRGSFWKGFAWGILAAILIAIAGSLIVTFVLVGTVTSSLDDARMKGSVAAVRSNVSILRAQAELYFDKNNSSYVGACQSEVIATALKNIKVNAHEGDVVCYDSVKNYAIAATVKDVDGIKTTCVDSVGSATFSPGKASESASIRNYSCY